MPTKLANAWGINSAQLSSSVSQQFKQFEEVLTHPLFVGLFCMMLSHSAINSANEKLFIEENKTNYTFDLKEPITLDHINFLIKVIEFGLEINIKDRKDDVSPNMLGNIRTIFCYLAAAYQMTNIKKMDYLLRYIKKYHGVKISEQEEYILKNNLGIMFINGENQIDWTHKNIAEVGLGILISEDEKFRNYLINKHGYIFGGKNAYGVSIWSEAALMSTIFQAINNYDSDDSEAMYMTLREIIPVMSKRHLNQTYRMFGIKQGCLLKKINYKDNNFTFTAQGGTKTKRNLLKS